SSSSGRVASTNAARHASRLGHSFGCFALATLPVSLSRSAYARSPTTPPSLTSTASSSSPSIDLTGYLHSARIVPTRSLEFILPSWTSSASPLPSRRSLPLFVPASVALHQAAHFNRPPPTHFGLDH